MKALLLCLLLALTLHASDVNHHQIRILEKILSEISIDKELSVWSDNKMIIDELKNNQQLNTSNSCEDADILILQKKENLTDRCKSKCIFVLNYNHLSEIKQSFGALFWKKGRPNIVIIEPRLKKQNITISKNLEPYLEEKVW